jgi:dipeptidyl aminopeptidase/acylaminoacyl peptidase
MSGGVPREVLENVAYAGADFSPDGKQLAVVHVVDGESRLEFPIGHVLVPAGVDSPRFSPDGDSIAFYETVADSISISVIDRLGKTKKALSSGWRFVSGAPCWTPDGREIWFTASQPGQTEALWSVDRSGRRRLVTRVPGTLELDDIARDGRVLLAHHLPLHSLKGLAPGESKERDLSWLDASFPSDLSSDGRTLLLTEQQEGAGPVPVIYLRNTNGAPAVRLGEGFGLALSPDAKWVLTGMLRPSHLSLLPTGPGEAKNLDADGLLEFPWGAFTPDGGRVVFSASGKDDQSRLYVQEVAGGKPRAISEAGARLQPASSPVSPDGRRFFALKAGKVVIFSIDGGEPRPIPGLPPGDIPMQWSLDGRSLYVYVYRRESPVKVWLVDVDTGEKRLWKEIAVETPGGALRLRITPDGKSYVYRTIRVFSALYLVEGLR